MHTILPTIHRTIHRTIHYTIVPTIVPTIHYTILPIIHYTIVYIIYFFFSLHIIILHNNLHQTWEGIIQTSLHIFSSILKKIYLKKDLKNGTPSANLGLNMGGIIYRIYTPFYPGVFCHSYIDLSLISGFFDIP